MMMRMKQMIKMVTWVKDGNGENDDMGKNGGRLLEARTQLVLTLEATGQQATARSDDGGRHRRGDDGDDDGGDDGNDEDDDQEEQADIDRRGDKEGVILGGDPIASFRTRLTMLMLLMKGS